MKMHLCTSPRMALALIVSAAAGVLLARENPGQSRKPAAESSRTADEAAIRQQAEDFAAAFARADAAAIAVSWTEQAEYLEEGGVELLGRAAIEQAFAAFFSEHPGARISFTIESIRFPSRDLAVEEGISVLTHGGAELPSSSRYLVIHVREDGEWRTAIGREWGADDGRLQDLDWLIGDWSATTPEGESHIAFAWNPTQSAIDGTFEIKVAGKVVSSGHQHIVRDPEFGQLHSWMFDDEGGHGESVWTRDGNRWLLEETSVELDGTATSATNVLTRLNDDEFMWRSVNRTADDNELPDSDPVKLTRTKSGH